MDYHHHHLVSHHRTMVVEAASQRLGGCRHDVSESGHDVGNPYTCGKTELFNRPVRLYLRLACSLEM